MEKKGFLLILSLFVMFACSKTPEEKGTGYLTLNISQGAGLKADVEITDFTLRINDGYADVFHKRIGDFPEQIALPVGSYTVEAYSMVFDVPKFDVPFYTGKTIIEIEAGETTAASLVCSQGNAGIKVVWAGDFPDLYDTYQAQINSNEGYLTYSSTETRTGYFLPGTVSVSVLADGLTINSGTITLAARDLVTATLRTKETSSGSLTIDISIDVTVNEREVDVIIDPGYTGENSETNPYSVSQAIAHYEENGAENGVWITGYIVGSKPSTTSDFNFINGTWLNTNIAIADDIDETKDYNVIFVELTNAAQRNTIGLVGSTSQNYSDRLHRKVLIKGNLRSFYSPPHAGLRDITDYSLK